MSQVPQAERFQELLKKKFVTLGLPPGVAASASQKIIPVRQTQLIVFAECTDDFYNKNIVSKMLAEIDSVAKECWGSEIQLVIQQAAPALSGMPSPSRARRKRTSARVEARDSLFTWEPDAARADAAPLARDKEQASQDPNRGVLQTQDRPNTARGAEPTKNQSGQTSSPDADNRKAEPQSAATRDPLSMPRPIANQAQGPQTGAAPVFGQTETTPDDRKRSGAASAHPHSSLTNLQRDFLFDTYVRGQSNMVAYSACEAVARSPGKLSNPVFIYGATGLGKTHLLHAVGNEILTCWPNWNIVYVSSQDFMNELITSIRFNKTGEFRTKYHAADVLLVDDIQFLESKESTQMEFFHIFNVLCEKKRQIVITSDKYPKDIPNIEERLKSRFLQGLIADIEPPSYEDRLAIIEAKAKMMNLELSEIIIAQIAAHVRSNVREIQGVLTNLLMGQSMTGKAPTPESTNEILRRIVNMKGPSFDVSTIQKVVAQHFSLKVSDLTSPKREKRLVLPRHIAMYLAKDLMNIALKEIAESFHRGDHTTVQHAIRKVEQLIVSDESTRASIKELKRKLEQCL